MIFWEQCCSQFLRNLAEKFPLRLRTPGQSAWFVSQTHMEKGQVISETDDTTLLEGV